MTNNEFLRQLFPNITFEWSSRTNQIVVQELSLQTRNMSLKELSAKIYQKYNKLYTVEEISETWRNEINLAQNAAKQDTNVQINPDDFVLEFLKANKNNYEINSNWTMIMRCKDGAKGQLTQDEFITDVLGYNDNVTHYKLSEGQISRSVKRLMQDKWLDGISDIIKNTAFNANCITSLDMLLDYIHDWFKIKEDKDIFKLLMKQWMWQVKRYVKCEKVKYHIWLNFTGATGLGKTEFLRLFCKPYEDFYTEDSVDVLLDSKREIKKLTNDFILNFDELARQNSNVYTDTASASEMAVLKSVLTKDVAETRAMGGQSQFKALKRCSCISSSNNHLYDVFYDPSSMRRYFEFECQLKEHPKSYAKFNNVMKFALEAWKGIDESNENGYFDPNSELGQKIREIQATYYPTNTTVHAWLEDLSAEMRDAIAKQNSNDAYQSYKSWCEQEHCHSKTRKNFIDAIKHYGVTFDENSASFNDMLEVEPEDKFTKKPMNTEIDFTETTSMKEVEANHEAVAKLIADSGNDDFISRIS